MRVVAPAVVVVAVVALKTVTVPVLVVVAIIMTDHLRRVGLLMVFEKFFLLTIEVA